MAALAAFHAPVSAAGPETLHRLTARVHFGHAETDLTPEALGELNRTLDAAGVDYTYEIYPGPVHGFTMSDTVPGSKLNEDWGEDEIYALVNVQGFGEFRTNTVKGHF